MAGYCKPYTKEEETTILNYIIENKAYNQLRGDAFWKGVEESAIVKRTWQSLKQHFKTKMAPKLASSYYNISRDELMKMDNAYKNTASQKANKKPITKPESNRDRLWLFENLDDDD